MAIGILQQPEWWYWSRSLFEEDGYTTNEEGSFVREAAESLNKIKRSCVILALFLMPISSLRLGEVVAV